MDTTTINNLIIIGFIFLTIIIVMISIFLIISIIGRIKKININIKISKTSIKHIFKGIIYLIIYIFTTIVFPIFLYQSLYNMPDIPGITISSNQNSYEQIVFWITAFGLIICGCAFFTHSSPKQSVRKAIFALIQAILNCFYIWSYRYSGASEIAFEIDNFGGLYLDLSAMITFIMGIYFLYILLRVYDVLDFAINKEKIQEKRRK